MVSDGQGSSGPTGLKVVHVTTDLAAGGAEMMLCKLLEHRNRIDEGIGHGVVSLVGGGSLCGRIRATGVQVEELDLRPGSIPLGSVFRLANAVRQQRPDIIQGWMYHGNVAATVAKCLLRSAPHLIWGVRHSPGTLLEEKTMTRAVIGLGRPLSRFCDAVVYCSYASARWHESHGYRAEKTVCIPNGFDIDAFRPDRAAKGRLAAECGISHDAPIVGVVARFHPQKDFRNLTAAAALLVKKVRDVQFVLVGSGIDRMNRDLTEVIGSSGIQDRVTLLGERHDVARIMPGFDLLCSGSAWGEAFPNVLGEAMASGVPCVATDVGDCALIIGDTGVIVPPRNPEALAGGLEQLIALGTEGRRRLGMAARQRVIENFSIAEVVRQYEALYRRVALLGEQVG